jgi:ribonuclease E
MFDWSTFAATTIPPAEPEPWWERRRAERVARQARRADDDGPKAAHAPADAEPPAMVPRSLAELDAEPLPVDAASIAVPVLDATISVAEPSAESEAAAPPALPGAQPAGETGPRRRRRRRGGRRRRRSQDQPQAGSVAPPTPDAGDAAQVEDNGPDDGPSDALDGADDPAENGGSSSED